MTQIQKVNIGISTCLLGEKVRFDGGHKRNRFITDVLSDHFSWVPVCPEVEVGMSTPRESLRLAEDGESVKMIAPKSGQDWTERMEAYSEKRVQSLKAHQLRGYILKKDSPSCGMERVRLYNQHNMAERKGIGLYAKSLMKAYPNLPMEEEGRLQDPRLRENFITRVFTYDRWCRLRDQDVQPKDLVNFHTAHKMLLLAHSETIYRDMGPLVAQAGSAKMETLLDQYEEKLMAALKTVASPKRHTNVLYHLAGFLKEHLNQDEKQELLNAIEEYRQNWVPLITPLTLMQHHFRSLKHAWINTQVYLDPFPRSLALRSSI